MSKSTWRATASALGIAVLALAGAACGGDDEASAEHDPVPVTSAASSPTANSAPTPTTTVTPPSAGEQADLDRIVELCEAMSGPDSAMQDFVAAVREGERSAALDIAEDVVAQVEDLAEEAEPFPRLAEDLDDYADVLNEPGGDVDAIVEARDDVDTACLLAAADVG